MDKNIKYVREHRIAPLLNDMVMHLLATTPEDPLVSLIRFLQRHAPEKETEATPCEAVEPQEAEAAVQTEAKEEPTAKEPEKKVCPPTPLSLQGEAADILRALEQNNKVALSYLEKSASGAAHAKEVREALVKARAQNKQIAVAQAYNNELGLCTKTVWSTFTEAECLSHTANATIRTMLSNEKEFLSAANAAKERCSDLQLLERAMSASRTLQGLLGQAEEAQRLLDVAAIKSHQHGPVLCRNNPISEIMSLRSDVADNSEALCSMAAQAAPVAGGGLKAVTAAGPSKLLDALPVELHANTLLNTLLSNETRVGQCASGWRGQLASRVQAQSDECTRLALEARRLNLLLAEQLSARSPVDNCALVAENEKDIAWMDHAQRILAAV